MLSFAALLWAGPALAEQAPPGDGPLPRLRFGIGLVSGVSEFPNCDYYGTAGCAAPTPLGVDLRLGLQASEGFAVLYQASFAPYLLNGALFVLPQWRNAVLFEGTWANRVSAGIGPALDWLPISWFGDGGGAGPLSFGVLMRLAFSVHTWRSAAGRRSSLSLHLDLTPSGVIETGDRTLGNGQIGLMGGVSYELY